MLGVQQQAWVCLHEGPTCINAALTVDGGQAVAFTAGIKTWKGGMDLQQGGKWSENWGKR